MLANSLSLFQLGLKSAVCIGFPEERILMLIYGELHANAIIPMKSIPQIILISVNCVASAMGLKVILHVFLVMGSGKIMKLYGKRKEKEEVRVKLLEKVICH